MNQNKETFVVQEAEKNERLDRVIAIRFQDISRTQIQLWIKEHNVLVNQLPTKAAYHVQSNDVISFNIPTPKSLDLVKEEIPLDIRYEDEDLLVINKPQGMVVHPANGHDSGTLVNALLAHCHDLSGINGVARPGIVHRIDKDTSGLLLVAKNDYSHLQLAKQIKEKTAERFYVALVHGEVKDLEGMIDAPIGRHPTSRKKMAVVDHGKPAITHFTVLERYSQFTLLACRLETGRTHQIRVHLAWIGHPVAGDPVYGPRKPTFVGGQLLHAQRLRFIHPRTNLPIDIFAPLPTTFETVIDQLRPTKKEE